MNNLSLLLFFAVFLSLSCKSLSQLKTITVKGQLIDQIGHYPVPGVKVKINDSNKKVITDNRGFFTIKSHKKGLNELTFEWWEKRYSIMMIEFNTYRNYDLGKIQIDAPMAFPKLLEAQ